jgi:hypothetical protein
MAASLSLRRPASRSAAKAGAGALVGIVLGIAAEVFAIAVGTAGLSARGIPVRLDSGDYIQLVIGGAVAAAIWAPIGLGLGALLRNQVATLVGIFVWLLFVEDLLFGNVADASRFLPGIAGAALAGVTTAGQVRPLLTPALGALVLAAYAAVAIAAGSIITTHRDVN